MTSTTEHTLTHADGSYTWYRRTRPLGEPRGLPLVVVHGGPGMAHDYLNHLDRLADDGREVIQYDQVGCGRSSHHRDVSPSHWTVELFVDELARLTQHWDLTGGYHLLGQSWGGMLAPEFVLRHPQGVASLTLLNSPASMVAWAEGTQRLVEQLPAEHRRAIAHHEQQATFDHPDYVRAVEAFYARHLCRVQPTPTDLQATLDQCAKDPTVYQAMIGPSEFTITGSLATWSVAERVGGITVPTLVAYGEHDEATDSWRPFAEGIRGAEVHGFAGASHTPHLETPDEFDAVVTSFLRRHDP